MKTKCYAALLIVLGSLCWLAMMTVFQVEKQTVPMARFLFLMIFAIATIAGLLGIGLLFTEIYEGSRGKGGKHE
jgi:hypothetical protein